MVAALSRMQEAVERAGPDMIELQERLRSELQLKERIEVLERLLVVARIRCERAEKRLAQELRQKGELKP